MHERQVTRSATGPARCRWRIPLVAVSLATLVAAPPPVRAGVVLEHVSESLSVDAEVRSRWEQWNWFEASGPSDDEYGFAGIRARMGLTWSDDSVDIVVQAQSTALLSLPDDAVAPAPQGPAGLGAVYALHNRDDNDASVFLKQAYARFRDLGVEGLTLQGGRFEFLDGREVMTGEPTLDWLKKFRIGERLIGPFGFSHVARSYDGAVAALTRDAYNVTAMFSRPTQGGFDLDGNDQMEDIDLVYVSFNLTRPDFAEDTDARVFYIFYGDGRDLTKVDNRPLSARAADRQDINLHTFGGHWLHVLPTDRGPVDLLAWGLMQRGDWGVLEQRSWAWDLEAGWQPARCPWKPWVRVGFGRSSGDGDPADRRHETFFQILPTARLYSWSTFYNLMNNEDGFAQLILRPRPGLVWRTDFHNIRVTEPDDLWYQGAGATLARRQVGFGYAGRPTGGNRDLLRVVETQVVYALNPHLQFTVYYGHEFGGDIVDDIFKGTNADFGYLEMTLRL